MNGPTLFRGRAPVPASQASRVEAARRRALAGLPWFDNSAPDYQNAVTDNDHDFEGPAQTGGGAAIPQPGQRQFNLYTSLALPISATAPALTDDPNRNFLLVQNLDPSTTLLVSFGAQPQTNNALQLLAGVGFVWDINAPNNSMYLNWTGGAGTVLPIGLIGARTYR